MRWVVMAAVIAAAASGCSSSTPPPPEDAAASAAILHKDCTDPRWKEQNLGLWYSVCRQPMRW